MDAIRYYGQVARRALGDIRSAVERHIVVNVLLVIAATVVTSAIHQLTIGLAALGVLFVGIVIYNCVMAPVRIATERKKEWGASIDGMNKAVAEVKEHLDAYRRVAEDSVKSMEDVRDNYRALQKRGQDREHFSFLVLAGEKCLGEKVATVDAQKWVDQVSDDLRERLGGDYAERFQTPALTDSNRVDFVSVRLERLRRIVRDDLSAYKMEIL